MFKKAVAILTTIAMAILLGACSHDLVPKKDEGKKYNEVRHLNMPISPIKTLNPVTSKDEDTYFLSRLLYDGLFEMDDDMIPQPNLAATYKTKGNCVTIELTDTVFHDGEKLVAKDVKFSIQAYKEAGERCPYSSLVTAISQVKTKGSGTVKIYFKSKTDMSLDHLTFPILPAHSYDSIYEVAQNTKGKFKPVGTGPYKYRKYNKEKSLELVANDEYHGEKAKNSLSFIVVNNKSQAFQLVEASSLSALVSRAVEREVNVSDKEQKITTFPANEIEYIGFNFNNNKTNDRNMRKAIATAIDNATIIQETYMNSGMQNDSIFYPGYMGVEAEKDPYAYDEDKATEYLEKAGYKDRDNDGYAENENGDSLTLTLLVDGDDERRVETAETIGDNLEDIGLYTYMQKLGHDNYIAALKNNNFDFFIGGMKYDETMDMRQILEGKQSNSENNDKESERDALTHSADEDENTTEMAKKGKENLSIKTDNSNFGRYYNGDVNKLLDKMKSGVDTKDIKAAFEEVKGILAEDLPYYCLFQKTYGFVASPTLSGEPDPLFDNYYRGIEKLYCKYEKSDEKADEEQNQ